MTEAEIKSMLDQLADWGSKKDMLDMQKQDMVDGAIIPLQEQWQAEADAILTEELKAKIKEIEARYSALIAEKQAEIDAEFADKPAAIDANIEKLTAEIKRAVIENGASIKGEFVYAVYAKGRISWDPKSLDGYAIGHPEILGFRKEGEPSVSIRRI